ncbi:MAG: VCBS domain-containing protein, partial [Cellvibrionales bacterium]|nr:VCBS domain-containing protein [Cellvibrionales bacterium]
DQVMRFGANGTEGGEAIQQVASAPGAHYTLHLDYAKEGEGFAELLLNITDDTTGEVLATETILATSSDAETLSVDYTGISGGHVSVSISDVSQGDTDRTDAVVSHLSVVASSAFNHEPIAQLQIDTSEQFEVDLSAHADDADESVSVSLAGLPKDFTVTDGAITITCDGEPIDITALTQPVTIKPVDGHTAPLFLEVLTTSSEALGDSLTVATPLIITPNNQLIDVPMTHDVVVTFDEDTSYALSADDIPYVVYNGNELAIVSIKSVSGEGTLTYQGNPLEAGLVIPVDQLDQIQFMPEQHAHGELMSFTFTVSDGNNESTEKTFIFKANPINDLPEITGVMAASFTEDESDALIAEGKLAISDIDAGEAEFIETTYEGIGSLSVLADGAWSYVADNGKESIQSISDGESVVDRFEVASKDGTLTVIEMTITGVNDTPVITNSVLLPTVSDDQILQTSDINNLKWPTIASLPNGNFIATWHKGVGTEAEIITQQYDAKGQPVGDEIQTTQMDFLETDSLLSPEILVAPEGNYAVVYPMFRPGAFGGSMVRFYDQNGVPQADEYRVSPGDTFAIEGTFLDNGLFALAASKGAGDLVINILATDGEVIHSAEYPGLIKSGFSRDILDIAATEEGGFAVLYEAKFEDNREPRVQFFDADGEMLGLPKAVPGVTPDANQIRMSLDKLVNGDLIAGFNLNDEIVAHRLSSDGNWLGDLLFLSSQDAETQTFDVEFVSLQDGGFFAYWKSSNDALTGTRAYGQHFNADGDPQSEPFLLLDDTYQFNSPVSVTQLINGQLVYTWTSFSLEGTHFHSHQINLGSQVSEKAQMGDIVGQAAIDDIDSELTFSLSNDAGGRFVIDAETGIIRVKEGAEFNANVALSHSITIEATDGIEIVSQTQVIKVNQVNTAPRIEHLRLTISEGDTLVLTSDELLAVDRELPANFIKWVVTDVQQGHFEGVTPEADGSLVFTQKQINDGEISFVHDGSQLAPSFSVQVTDGEFTTLPKPLTVVDFISVNDAPEYIQALPNEILVYDFSTTSDYNGNQPIELLGSADVQGGVLNLNQSGANLGEMSWGGALTIATTFTYYAHSNWTRIFDFGGGPGRNNLLIGSVSQGDLSVRIMHGSKIVTSLDVSDAYTLGERFHITLTVDDQGGIRLYKNGALVGEVTDALIPLEITSDQNFLGKSNWSGNANTQGRMDDFIYIDKALDSVAVNALYQKVQVNDFAAIAALSVDEDALAGQLVGDIVASDVDGDTLSYSLLNDADGRFVIDEATGVIRVSDSASFDFETISVHQVTVQISDGEATVTEFIQIAVNDVNDMPTLSMQTLTGLKEDTPYTFSEADLLGGISDEDANQPEWQVLSVRLDDDAAGVITQLDNGDWQYVPKENFSSDAVKVTVEVTDSDYQLSL